MTVRLFTPDEGRYERAPEQDGDIFLGNVLDSRDGAPFTVGYVRYTPHQENSETLGFDEAMVILEGRLSVESTEGTVTAMPGEIVTMAKGTTVTYRSHEAGALIAYVTYPHWKEALR